MPISSCDCPVCHRSLGVPEDVLGKKAKCRNCGAILTVTAMGDKTILTLDVVDRQAITTSLPGGMSPLPVQCPGMRKPKRSYFPVLMALGLLLTTYLLLGCMGYLLLVDNKFRHAEEMRDLHAAWKLAIWRAELAKESSTFEGRQAGIARGQTSMPPEPEDVSKVNGPEVTAVRKAYDKRSKIFLKEANSRQRDHQEIQRMFDEFWWSSCLEDQALAEQLNRRARERFGVSAGELPALMRRRP